MVAAGKLIDEFRALHSTTFENSTVSGIDSPTFKSKIYITLQIYQETNRLQKIHLFPCWIQSRLTINNLNDENVQCIILVYKY